MTLRRMTLPIYEPVVRQICGVDFVFTDYKEPLVQLKGAVKGYMRGTLPNALADGRLPCAFCDPSKTHRIGHRTADYLFDNLGLHVRRAHGMSTGVYREAIGLLWNTPLTSRRLHLSRSATARARPLRSPFRKGYPNPHSAETRAAIGRAIAARAVSPEHLNKHGHCRDQVLAVARKNAAANAGTLTMAGLRRQGIWQDVLRRVGFADVNALAVEIGAPTFKGPGLRLFWRRSDQEILEELRRFADSLGRTPTLSDLRGRRGVASPTNLRRRFGSHSEAMLRAGLIPNACSRPMTEGDEIDILNQYARTGSVNRTSRATHRGDDRVSMILAKYGVALHPPHLEAERTKAREWAAEIAQRLAGTEEMNA